MLLSVVGPDVAVNPKGSMSAAVEDVKDASAVEKNLQKRRTRHKRRWGGELFPRRSDLGRPKRKTKDRPDTSGSSSDIRDCERNHRNSQVS